MSGEDFTKKYFQAFPTENPEEIEIFKECYKKHEDLRYGTNPHQKASIYRPKTKTTRFHYRVLKTGKGGLSQSNYEDLHHAIQILKYQESATTVIMKHANPCGVATRSGGELSETYILARDADPRAAFGGFVCINREIDETCAAAIMSSITECVAAPAFTGGAVQTFHDWQTYKKNKHIRLIEISDPTRLPKYLGDSCTHKEIKQLLDGSIILTEPYLTRIKSPTDLIIAHNNKDATATKSTHSATTREYADLLFAWHINISTRSNGIVIVKDKRTLAISSGQQDRIGAIEIAITKAQRYAHDLHGAVLSSDGFFPFRDSIDLLAKHGITAIVQPGGSLQDRQIIEACNEQNIAMLFTDERCFAHH